ncbi:MBL fold metallo-hydrolase [Ekhidna sp. To15]|uniref:MBL fold metallo-hydrolase n=1 Tax=Ekhidna sp. To15 TaxID=3395267 RepID=UPI003F5206A0
MRLKITLILLLVCQLTFGQYILVLGTSQDGGFPHIGCQNECQKAHKNPEIARFVTSLALVDPESKQWWLFEATPDMDDQLHYFRELTDGAYPYLPSGIFLTHAHIGHYTGLMTLGKEALSAKGVKVYALPRMIDFLKSNGPWSQLITLGNIDPMILSKNLPVELRSDLTVEAFTVPHRDEFSETAGYRINKRRMSYLFIPDIDKWSKWDRSIAEILKDPLIEYAFLDATFYSDGELPNRAMNEVPHPFVTETMDLFETESRALKRKIVFIHFNHTNPLLFKQRAKINVLKEGYGIAEQGKRYE